MRNQSKITKGRLKMADTTATEKKVRSIRADEATFNRFKEICERTGGQQEALTALISCFELDQAKSILQGQATLIDDFKSRIDGVVGAYINALELSANAEERIRAEFRLNIDTQAKTIADLQEKNEKLNLALSNAQAEFDETITSKDSAISELTAEYNTASERATTADKQREQAEQIANMATEQVQTLKTAIDELKDKADKSDSYKSELEKLQKQVSELTAQAEKAEQERKDTEERYKHDIEVAVKVAVADTKEQYQAKIEEMQKEHAKQIADLLAQQNKGTKRAEGKK